MFSGLRNFAAGTIVNLIEIDLNGKYIVLSTDFLVRRPERSRRIGGSLLCISEGISMSTYDYRCRECGHTFEEYQPITADPLVVCPKCGKHSLKRLMGTGGGLIFKGSGFYQTDYKKNGSSPSTPTDKKKIGAASTDKKGSDAKPVETKSTEPKSTPSEPKSGGSSKKSD